MTTSYVTWLIHMWRSLNIKIQVIWLQQTRFYVTWLHHIWHDSFTCATASISRSESYGRIKCFYVTWVLQMWHNSFIYDVAHSNVTWLLHMWRDSVIKHSLNLKIRVICPHHTRLCVTWILHMWHNSIHNSQSQSQDLSFLEVTKKRKYTE
jgi:hypothetical protein